RTAETQRTQREKRLKNSAQPHKEMVLVSATPIIGLALDKVTQHQSILNWNPAQAWFDFV
ncbi:MAG: hypothetical protein NWQ28_07120, partial [Nodularia sp. (in: cyanobacteria)]|nr:hypothetical protein [Nodularia sp. (in: cyanobacteria)]